MELSHILHIEDEGTLSGPAASFQTEDLVYRNACSIIRKMRVGQKVDSLAAIVWRAAAIERDLWLRSHPPTVMDSDLCEATEKWWKSLGNAIGLVPIGWLSLGRPEAPATEP